MLGRLVKPKSQEVGVVAEFSSNQRWDPDPSDFESERIGQRFERSQRALLDEFYLLYSAKNHLHDYYHLLGKMQPAEKIHVAEGLADEIPSVPDPIPWVCLDVMRHLGDTLVAQAHELAGEEERSYDVAERLYRQCIDRAQPMVEEVRGAYAMLKLGDLRNLRYDYDGAATCFEKAIAVLDRQISDQQATIVSYTGELALAYERLGEDDLADLCCQRIMKAANGSPTSQEGAQYGLCSVAELYKRRGDMGEAAIALERALLMFERNPALSASHAYPKALIELAGCQQSFGEYEDAEKNFRKAYEARNTPELKKQGDGLLIEARDGLVEVLKALGRFDEAWDIEAESDGGERW
jgi:tetratricopeptide (TPR) repeat protein